jgi:hypothetical protein
MMVAVGLSYIGKLILLHLALCLICPTVGPSSPAMPVYIEYTLECALQQTVQEVQVVVQIWLASFVFTDSDLS